jgi:hypothetical protein
MLKGMQFIVVFVVESIVSDLAFVFESIVGIVSRLLLVITCQTHKKDIHWKYF